MEDLTEEGEVVGDEGVVDEHDSAWLLEQNAWLMEELDAKDGECLVLMEEGVGVDAACSVACGRSCGRRVAGSVGGVSVCIGQGVGIGGDVSGVGVDVRDDVIIGIHVGVDVVVSDVVTVGVGVRVVVVVVNVVIVDVVVVVHVGVHDVIIVVVTSSRLNGCCLSSNRDRQQLYLQFPSCHASRRPPFLTTPPSCVGAVSYTHLTLPTNREV